MACPVFAHPPPPPAAPIATAAAADSSAGSTARPTATAAVPACMAGFRTRSWCSAASAPTPQHDAIDSRTRLRPGPAGSMPARTSAASSYAATRTLGGNASGRDVPLRRSESSDFAEFLEATRPTKQIAKRKRSAGARVRAPPLSPPAPTPCTSATPFPSFASSTPISSSISTSVSASISASISAPPGEAAAPPCPHSRCATLSVLSIAGARGSKFGCMPTKIAAGSSPEGGSTATRAHRPARGSARAPAAARLPIGPRRR